MSSVLSKKYDWQLYLVGIFSFDRHPWKASVPLLRDVRLCGGKASLIPFVPIKPPWFEWGSMCDNRYMFLAGEDLSLSAYLPAGGSYRPFFLTAANITTGLVGYLYHVPHFSLIHLFSLIHAIWIIFSPNDHASAFYFLYYFGGLVVDFFKIIFY